MEGIRCFWLSRRIGWEAGRYDSRSSAGCLAPFSSKAGFTQIELLIAIGIIAVLATIVIVGWPRAIAASESARCMTNMRSLQTSLNSYVQDVGHWPQVPEEIDVSSAHNDKAYEDWWIEELKNFGATPDVWMCPTIRRTVVKQSPDGRPRISYTPTPFDRHPYTPYKWSTQPWLVEIGNAHGRGALLCFPDGSIRSVQDVFGAQAKDAMDGVE